MGMGLRHAVFGHVPMHIEIGDHAPIDELRPNEVAGKLDALRLSHLARDGEFHLAGELGVLADLEGLDIVPEPFAVGPCLGRVVRQHHLGMDDAALGREVVAALEPVVPQPRRRAVGGGGHRARAGRAADDLDVEVIDRHRDPISGTGEANVGTTYKRALPRKVLGSDRPVPHRPGDPAAFRNVLNYHRCINSLSRR